MWFVFFPQETNQGKEGVVIRETFENTVANVLRSGFSKEENAVQINNACPKRFYNKY